MVICNSFSFFFLVYHKPSDSNRKLKANYHPRSDSFFFLLWLIYYKGFSFLAVINISSSMGIRILIIIPGLVFFFPTVIQSNK